MPSRTLDHMRADVMALFKSGVLAADAFSATIKSLKVDGDVLFTRDILGHTVEFDLARFKRIVLIGFGKAGAPMACACEKILQDRVREGIIIVNKTPSTIPKNTRIIEAGHPLPDARSIEGAQQVADMARRANRDDLVIFLISGGGSALCTLPGNGITIADLQLLTVHLLNSGATILELNTVRKHLSKIKGGHLARLTHPATTLSLIISDVINDRLEVIASGPTVPDPTTFQDAQKVLEKYRLLDRVPTAIQEYLNRGLEGKIQETPKDDDHVFRKTTNLIVANNLTALRSVAESAAQKGYRPFILSSQIEGNTRQCARVFAMMAKYLSARRNWREPICMISGGEMTVRVRGSGTGGRNTDFCLALAPMIRNMDDVVVLSAGTDGIDGMTDAAGAIIDGTTWKQAYEHGLDIESALTNNDSYTLLRELDRLVFTGPTETNVMDIQIMLIS